MFVTLVVAWSDTWQRTLQFSNNPATLQSHIDVLHAAAIPFVGRNVLAPPGLQNVKRLLPKRYSSRGSKRVGWKAHVVVTSLLQLPLNVCLSAFVQPETIIR